MSQQQSIQEARVDIPAYENWLYGVVVGSAEIPRLNQRDNRCVILVAMSEDSLCECEEKWTRVIPNRFLSVEGGAI